MKFIISKLHYLIIFYIAFTVYEKMEAHNKQLEDILSQKDMFNSKIIASKKKIKQAKSFVKDLEASRNQVKEVARQIEVVQKQLPNEANDTEILGMLSRDSEALKMRDIVMTPKGEQLKDFYFVKEYSMTAIGTYLQGLIFFERLNNLDRLINVNAVKIETIESKKGGRYQLVKMDYDMEVYRYNPAYTQDTGIDTIKNKFKDGGKKDLPRSRKNVEAKEE